MNLSSKAADVLLETGNCFKRIAELTMELVDSNITTSSTTATTTRTTSAAQKTIDSLELKRLRDALNRFSADLDAVSQRLETNRTQTSAEGGNLLKMSVPSAMNIKDAYATDQSLLTAASTASDTSTALGEDSAPVSIAVSN
ncbi:unnamed protein product [Didymodactylos carnosus]|uniref:Uncharacterized protein n=1 Tax=Didymodactylos carnosus TaxID=1234261 RepID=A0A813XJV6_9BILA|nr:unnamed protein product [Didymodactylos carnosus]CAF0865970.1 unnamed protein product [Didymodactylos carnosus]CAF3625466.1 unnamed protein product [Didymodactylos carnosus]CAF3653468.1 unnamed protein product [Didymodactylos carnosus]